MAVTPTKIITTAKVDGGAFRLIEIADGSGRIEWRIEEWKARERKWVPGGADLDELLGCTPPITSSFAAGLGIPLSDIRVAPPVRTAAPAKLTEKDLREAIKLGVRLAEEAALWKLTMKAKQVAELDRRRPRLVWDRDRLTE